MAYRVEFTPAAGRQYRKLPPTDKERVRNRIDRLSQEPRPRGREKLTGSDVLLRVRVGDYRIIYEARDDALVVVIVVIGNRRDVYDKHT